MATLSPSDHVRLDESDATAGGATPGVYRVVGTGDDAVTLLRVADADGRREHTGDVVTVDDDTLAAFTPADNPDGNRSPTAALAGSLDGLWWQLRTFVQGLAERPLLSIAAIAVLAVGFVGEEFVSGPEWAFTLAVLGGSLVLAAVGAKLF